MAQRPRWWRPVVTTAGSRRLIFYEILQRVAPTGIFQPVQRPALQRLPRVLSGKYSLPAGFGVHPASHTTGTGYRYPLTSCCILFEVTPRQVRGQNCENLANMKVSRHAFLPNPYCVPPLSIHFDGTSACRRIYLVFIYLNISKHKNWTTQCLSSVCPLQHVATKLYGHHQVVYKHIQRLLEDGSTDWPKQVAKIQQAYTN
jgi:hypothetical protein